VLRLLIGICGSDSVEILHQSMVAVMNLQVFPAAARFDGHRLTGPTSRFFSFFQCGLTT
jgi:hypothetical protein